MRGEVTRIIHAIEDGDPSMADELLPLVYAELRRMAARRMADERAGHTLQATALVHEAYLRLIDVPDRHWNSRNHFFMAAAEAMRRILIDRARAKSSQKRGGGWQRVNLEKLNLAEEPEPDALIAVHDALDKLEANDPVKASLVKLKFFAGLTNDEAAAALDISVPTVKRYWRFARAWLLQEIERTHQE